MLRKPLDSHNSVRTLLITGLPLILACVILNASTWAFAQPPVKGDDPTPYVRLNVPGHTAPVNAIAFSRDSQRLFTAGHDKAVHVWQFNADRSAYVPAGVFRWEVGHGSRGRIRGLGVSPGLAGHVAVAGFGNRGLQGEIVWLDPNDASFFASYFPKSPGAPGFDARQHYETIWNVAFSPDGALFASADIQGRVLLWSGKDVRAVAPDQPNRRELVLLHQLREPIEPSPGWCPIAFVGPTSLAFYAPADKPSPGGNVWHVQRAHFDPANPNAAPQVQTLPLDYDAPIYALAGSEDGRYVAAASERELVLYDLQDPASPKPIQLAPPNNAERIRSLALSPNGKFLAVGWELPDGNGKVELWDTATGSRTGWQVTANRPVEACAFNADPVNTLFAYASGSGNDVTIAAVNGNGNVQPLGKPLRGGDAVQIAGFEAGAKDRNQRIYFQTKADDDAPARWLVFDPEREGDDRLSHLPDGAAPPNLYNETANPDDLERKFVLDVIHGTKVTKACWIRDLKAPNGPKVAVAIATAPANLIFLYDVRGNAGPLRVFQGHESPITSLNISPDQRFLVSSAADGIVSLWSLDSFHRDRRAKSPADVARLKWGIDLEPNNTKIDKLEALGPLYIRGLKPGHVLDKMDWYDLEGNPLQGTTRSQMQTAMQQARHMNQSRFHAKTLAGPFRAQVFAGWFPMLSLYAHHREWIAWTPKGIYDASTSGERLISLQFTQKVATRPFFEDAEAFNEKYYKPDIIRQLILKPESSPKESRAEPEPLPASPDMVAKVKFESPLPGNVLQPEIKIVARITPAPGQTTLRIIPFYRPRAGGPQTPGPVKVEPVANRATVDYEQTITLPNLIDYEVGLRVNEADLDTVLVRWKPPVPPVIKERVLWLLAVGVSDYPNLTALPHARTDAINIVDVFEKRHAKDYYKGGVRPKLLVGDDTKESIIIEELDKLMAQRSAGDAVVFYFAGHGIYNETDGFCLVTKDVQSKELTSRKLLEKFATTGDWGKLMILDACQSGGAVDDLKRHLEKYARQVRRELCTTSVFAACEREQAAGDIEGGLFTECVLNGLRGKDMKMSDDFPHINAYRMAEYYLPAAMKTKISLLNEVRRQVASRANEQVQHLREQSPVYLKDTETEVGSLPLARRPE